MRHTIIALIIITILTACTPPDAEIVEVTRIVTETEQVEITRLVDVLQDVEVTRIVEVPVTVEATRIVEVEVTRLVEVVVTATPEPTPLPTETPEQAPAPAASVYTASGVLDVLRAAGLPIGDSIQFTAETDPNELLGRPGGYVGKINFRDTRLGIEHVNEFKTPDGGSIEVFADVASANAREQYIAALGGALPMLVEYHVQHGPVLLRLSKRLTPEQVADYEAVMANLN